MAEKGLFRRFRSGLLKTAQTLGMGRLFGLRKLDTDFLNELEEAFIAADLGPMLAGELVEELGSRNRSGEIAGVEQAKAWLRAELARQLMPAGAPAPAAALTPAAVLAPVAAASKPAVWFFLGVNGSGKTTAVGRIAHRLQGEGRSVLLAAGDTFRAAAGAQLEIWAERTGSAIVRHKEGGDPAAVIFDAYDAAKNRGTDVLLVDTAGRLHNKKNLMAECEKMFRVLAKRGGQAAEVFLVLDAATGQNAVQQALLFREVAPLTGIILTKLDGTAKGGIAFRLVRETGLPIRYAGLGEGMEDIEPFNAAAFVDAILPEGDLVAAR